MNFNESFYIVGYLIVCIYILLGVIFGVTFTYIIFYVRERKKSLNWLKQCASYEYVFQSISKDLERELGVRKNIEQRLKNSEELLKKTNTKLMISEERLSDLLCYRQKYDTVVDELRIQSEVIISQKSEIKQMVYRLEEKNIEISEKEKLLFDFEKRFSERFEILANRIFECNEKKIDVQNKLSLGKLLSPLRLQLDSFHQEIQKRFSQEERERCTLFHEISNLQCLNNKIAQEAINLTQALKGNTKVQGNWGEVILNRVLESSGMREGHEFHTQVNVQLSDGRRLQPDVIVHLPNNKDIVIDAKTSLLDYEKYFNSSNNDERQIALFNHIASLRSHMRLLAKKDYQNLYSSSLHTFDCVLMFIPIESAFTIAIDHESKLLTEAMEYNIMLVSPTTLLVVLKIINNLWHYEYQNRYTKEIADRASRLYDKLRLFVDDINRLGQYIDKVQNNYYLAKRKLFEGSGNLVSQAEKLRLFGVKVKRPIASSQEHFSASQSFSSNQNESVSSFNEVNCSQN